MTGGETIPQKSIAETEDYRNEMDIVQRLLDENFITGELHTQKVEDLYQRFTAWCARTGERIISCVKFIKKLKEKGFEQSKGRKAPITGRTSAFIR